MNTPHVQRLSADVSVAPQLDPAAMAWAAQAGFKSVINNRPDFEGGPEQPTNAAIEAAAIKAGLRYAWLPVAPAVQTPQETARFAELLKDLPKPVLAFCRSGARSGKLYQAVMADGSSGASKG
jgi:uncharacterized protein (TIGR01244 family)